MYLVNFDKESMLFADRVTKGKIFIRNKTVFLQSRKAKRKTEVVDFAIY